MMPQYTSDVARCAGLGSDACALPLVHWHFHINIVLALHALALPVPLPLKLAVPVCNASVQNSAMHASNTTTGGEQKLDMSCTPLRLLASCSVALQRCIKFAAVQFATN